jgi:hypothetical protein
MNKLYQDSDAAALEASGMAADASRQALKGVAHPATTATAAGATGTAGLKAGEKITEKRK